jgi:hypothetical protein
MFKGMIVSDIKLGDNVKTFELYYILDNNQKIISLDIKWGDTPPSGSTRDEIIEQWVQGVNEEMQNINYCIKKEFVSECEDMLNLELASKGLANETHIELQLNDNVVTAKEIRC